MLHPDVRRLMDQARAAGAPDLCELPLQAARGLYREILAATEVPPSEVDTQDLRLAPRADHPALGLRVHTPRRTGPRDEAPHPVVLYFHGGGYVLGDVQAYDRLTQRLCAESRAMVVSVDYRLAPEHAFPAAFDDAWSAFAWLASDEGARRLGPRVDTGRLALAGDSAGAVLAAATALRARDDGSPLQPLALALLYPPAAGNLEGHYPSRQLHAAGPTLTQATIEWCCRHAFGLLSRAPDERAAPLRASRLDGLPPTLLMLASHDPLRDEALAFGEALMAAGNDTTLVECHGLPHGFATMGGAVPAARSAMEHVASFLRRALNVTA